MKDTLLRQIYEQTLSGAYDQNTVASLSETLQVPKNKITFALQQLFQEGRLIKAEGKPVRFLSRAALENQYNLSISDTKIGNLELWLAGLAKEPADFEKLVGYDGSLASLVEQCKATISYPPNGLPLMLTGETGTGKSLIARLTYEYASRQGLLKPDARFVSVNCSEYANNPELLTANLFGYVKGAFTGAEQTTPGLIELADGGVLFLDEVHNLKGECQEKLFQFMDQSIYHRMGDNKTWHTSHVRLIFATTEDPEKVLLKTLQRRIPMNITVPNLSKRGTYEKVQMIHSIFKTEQQRLNVRIKISSTVFRLLVSYPFPENIGGLKSTIQSSCVQALFQINDSGEMEITAKNLPSALSKNISVASLNKLEEPAWIYIDELLDLDHSAGNDLTFYQEIIESLENPDTFFAVWKAESSRLIQHLSGENSALCEQRLYESVRHVCAGYHMELSSKDLETLQKALGSFLRQSRLLHFLQSQNPLQVEKLTLQMKKQKFRYYSMASEIDCMLGRAFDYKLNDLHRLVLALLLSGLEKQQAIPKRMGVILAHGLSTASSISVCVNQLLAEYVFDAIDMPLSISQEQCIRELNDYLKKMDGIEELFLLVDLGSLEDVWKGLNIRNVNVGIINSLNLKMALSIGEGLKRGQPMEEIFETAKNTCTISYHIERNREKQKLIICSCASGLGVAEKLKTVILDSLPPDSSIHVLTYDYNSLLLKGIEDLAFAEYQVICVVGTLNPNIDRLPFVALDDLILQESTNSLDLYLKSYMDPCALAIFKKNIVKNFSLSNIMNALTILNPTKLLEHVANAIDRLQTLIDCQLTNNTCFGLYVHVSCLIERLVMNRGIENYKQIEHFQTRQKQFIDAVCESFQDVEAFYGVHIPVEEIGYMFDYVKNDKNFQKCV